MAGIAYRNLQIGKEAMGGMAAPRSERLEGSMTMTPERELHTPLENRRSLARNRRTSTQSKKGSLSWTSPATYQQILHLLAMSVKGNIAAAGGAAPYTYSFIPDLDGPNNQDTYTIEYGDTEIAWIADFCYAKSWTLACALNSPAEISAEIMSNFPTQIAVPPTAYDYPNLDDIHANNMSVYIDADWSALGTTKKSALITGCDIVLADTGLMAIKTANGTHRYEVVKESHRMLKANLELLVSTDAKAEFTAWEQDDPTGRAIRLEFIGPEMFTAGVSVGNHKFTVDIFGKYTTPPALLGERENSSVFSLELESFEDDSGNEYSFVVETDRATY